MTGSSKGLGKAMAIALGEAGARVVVNYCNGRERALATCEELRARGIQAVVCKADVTNERQVNKLVADTEKKLGKPDIVVLNATPDQPQLPIEKYDWAFYQSMLDFFIRSPFLLTRAVLPGMKSRRWGRIINIGSEVVSRGAPGDDQGDGAEEAGYDPSAEPTLDFLRGLTPRSLVISGAKVTWHRPLTLERLRECQLLIVAAPREKFSKAEFDALKAYVAEGGSLLIALGEGGEAALGTNVNYLTEEFGISCNRDAVLRSVYHKYPHPKEVHVQGGVLNSTLEKSAGAHHR